MPAPVLTTFCEDQIKAVRAAVKKSRRHSIDLRFTIPLPFSSFYFVLLAGRDTRRETVSVEEERRARMGGGVRSAFYAFLFVGLFIACLALLYVIKSEMGIDLFKGHLKDYLPFWR